MAEQPSQPSAPPSQPTQQQAGELAALLVAAGIAGAGAATVAAATAGTAAALLAILKLMVSWGYDARAVRAVLTLVTRPTPPIPPAGTVPVPGPTPAGTPTPPAGASTPPAVPAGGLPSPGPVPPVPAPEAPPRGKVPRPPDLFPAADRTDAFGRQNARERAADADPIYRAWFMLNTVRRIMERRRLGKSWEDSIRPERTYLEQHERARRARQVAAAKVDLVAEQPNQLTVNGRVVLVWRAHADDRTTWECAAADGRWFYADRPPVIGYPGMPHGGTCRCWPIKATPDALTGESVDEAVRSAMKRATGDHKHDRFPNGRREAS